MPQIFEIRSTDDVERWLDDHKVRRGFVSIGKPLDGRLCLVAAGSNWQVFGLERGEKVHFQEFQYETDACRHFVSEIARHLSAWT